MDIKLLKTSQGISLLYDNQQKRFKDIKIIDEIVRLNNLTKHYYDSMQQNYKIRAKAQKLFLTAPEGVSKPIVIEDCMGPSFEETLGTYNKEELKSLLRHIDTENNKLNEEYKNCEVQRNKLFKNLGNFIHNSVPLSSNENDNLVIKEWGNKKYGKNLSHYDLLPKIGLDCERGAKIVGNRGYFLTGDIAKLQMAISMYAVNFLNDKGYRLMIPPYFMNKNYMSKVAQLEQFDDELYHVSDSNNKDEYKYLIATSEQPIASYFADELLKKDDLPIKFCGNSPCFRKEAGHHKDCGGIFRVHQFDKIEQFVFCEPKDSWNIMEQMINISEEFYQSLEIPYRIINIVSGALNNSASKKYDLEGWFPGSQCYRELVSCSNCTEYQARNMNIKYVDSGDKNNKKYVHTLNSTLCALTRTICILCETHLEDNIIRLPKVLVPYFGKDHIELK